MYYDDIQLGRIKVTFDNGYDIEKTANNNNVYMHIVNSDDTSNLNNDSLESMAKVEVFEQDNELIGEYIEPYKE